MARMLSAISSGSNTRFQSGCISFGLELVIALLQVSENTPSTSSKITAASTFMWPIRKSRAAFFGTPRLTASSIASLITVDQVIRIGRSFSFDLARGDFPIQPMLSGKRLVVLSSRGAFGFAPGGVRACFNHLDPHLATVARYIGVAERDMHTIAIEYQEFGDARHPRSLAEAEARAVALAEELARVPEPVA